MFYRLTNNVCIDALRRRRDALSLETEDIRAVRSALDALPDDCREILTLREIGGLSYEELAAALRLELGTVRSRLNRARKRLADELMKTGNYSAPGPSKHREGGARR